MFAYIHINLHLYPLSGLLSLTGKKNLKASILTIALLIVFMFDLKMVA